MNQEITHDDRVMMAKLVMNLFDDWELAPQQRVLLLGLPEDTRGRSLTRYRQGDALPEEKDTLQRTYQLMEIHHALATTFPMNDAMAKYWVTTENVLLNDQTPLDVMLQDGLEGINRIRSFLDADEAW